MSSGVCEWQREGRGAATGVWGSDAGKEAKELEIGRGEGVEEGGWRFVGASARQGRREWEAKREAEASSARVFNDTSERWLPAEIVEKRWIQCRLQRYDCSSGGFVQIENQDIPGLTFKTHPNINKELFNNRHIIGLKDPNRPFPTGQNDVGLMKWRIQGMNESSLPLTVSGRETSVNIEYEATERFDLQNVVISVPLPAAREPPNVLQIDGEWRYDARSSALEWSILLIDNTNRSGSMEFVAPSADPSAFFPITIRFTAAKTFSDVKVVNVMPLRGGATPKYAQRIQLVTDIYQVV